jgi:trimeric autotransporter adhesin
VRISNSNVLPNTYNNSWIQISASNSTKFKDIQLQATAITSTPMSFTQPIKATTITCSNITACNIDILTSNLSATSNTSYWSSNNLVKKSGDTMSGYLQVSMCNGNVLMGSTSNAGAFISLNQGLAMFNNASNYPFYGIGVNEGGKMNIQSYYGITIGDKNITAITIQNGNVGVGVSNPSTKLDVAGTVNATAHTGATITALSNLGMYGSNTSIYSSNSVTSLSNSLTSLSNSVISLSNTTNSSFSSLSNSVVSFSNSVNSFSNSTNTSSLSLSNSVVSLSNSVNSFSNIFVSFSNTTNTNFVSLSNSGVSLSNYTYGMNSSNILMSLWNSNTAFYASNNFITLSNYTYGNVSSLSNFGLTLSSNVSLLSNNATSLSNYTYSNVSALSNFGATTTSNVSLLSNNATLLSNYTFSNVSSLSNFGLTLSSNASLLLNNATSLSNYTFSNVSSLSNFGLTLSSTVSLLSNNATSLSNYTFSNVSSLSNFGLTLSSNVSLLSNIVSVISTSLSNTSNSLVSYSNWETSRLNSLSNFAYNLNTSNSTITNVYTSNIVSSSGGTIGSLIMSGAGLALGGYNLLNNSGLLTSALKDATGLKINIDPSAGSMSSLSLLSKFGQYTDSVMVGVSTLELSNNRIFFKDGTTSNTIYSSNAITVVNSNITAFAISNANVVTNCNIISPTITTLSNTANWASNNLLTKSGGTMTGALYVSACNGGVYVGVQSNQGGFVSVNQGATMLNTSSNFPAYGIGCSSSGKVNLQGYYGLSFGDNVNTTMEIWNNCLGIGVSNPTTKLDVGGTINASNYTGSTITSLSNLGLYGSNTAVSALKNTTSLSNQLYLVHSGPMHSICILSQRPYARTNIINAPEPLLTG